MPTKTKPRKQARPRRKAKPIKLAPKRRPRTEQEKHDAKVRKERAKIKEETRAKLDLEYDVTLFSAEIYTLIIYLEHLGRSRTPTETRLLKKLRSIKGRKPDQPRAPKSTSRANSNHVDPVRRLRRDNRELTQVVEKIANRRPREDNAGRMFYKVRRDAQEALESIESRSRR